MRCLSTETFLRPETGGSGWRNDVRVSLIEVRELFEMDWKAIVDERLVVADTSVPGGDSERLFTCLDDVDLVIYEDGEFRLVRGVAEAALPQYRLIDIISQVAVRFGALILMVMRRPGPKIRYGRIIGEYT